MTGTQVTGQVTKRDGLLTPFDAQKVRQAIAVAGQAAGELDIIKAQHLTSDMVARPVPLPRLGIEIIQNCVEEVLVDAGYWHTARAYIVYREQYTRLRSLKHTLVDVGSTMEEYLEQRDWRVNADANQGYSLDGLILNVAGKVMANYWLSHAYSPKAGMAYREGNLHIHDLDVPSGYCAGWSSRRLLTEGSNGVSDKVEATPPQHMPVAIGQIVNFLDTLQNEWTGTQAFSLFDTYTAPLIRRDAMSYAAVKQSTQELIYNLNVPGRWGTQAPFTNLTFDWTCPADLREQAPYIGGEEIPFTYDDPQPEMDTVNRAYIEVMMTGDVRDRAFTFPILTYNIMSDFDWEHPSTTLLFEMMVRYGLPHFQNFLSSDLEPHMVRSMRYRPQLDLRELFKRGNGLLGSAEQTGSIGVVTVNCTRLGYLYAGDEAALLTQLDMLLAFGRDVLKVKRKFTQRPIDQGLYLYTRRYLGTLRNHFNTLGVNDINEMVRNFTHDADDITTSFSHAVAVRLLDHVRQHMTEFQEATGHLYNLKTTPAEGTTYRPAREDRKRWPGVLQAGTTAQPYYTNSSQLPVGYTDDPFEAPVRQEALQSKYTGGMILHLYMNEAILSPQTCKELVRRVLANFRLPYITITPTFSICPKHGYLSGRHTFCPKCDVDLSAQQPHGKCGCTAAGTPGSSTHLHHEGASV